MRTTVAALAIACAFGLSACGNGNTAPEPVRPVLAQKVAPGAPSTREVYSGEVRARHEAELGFRIPGKLLSRQVDAGARVAKGQVLARLDPEDARLAAEGARAQLASAESDFALARAELERHADLLAKKFISPSAFDARQNAFQAAKARLEQARSQAALAENQAGYATLVADADGVVVSVGAEPGQVLAAGQPVLKLARAGALEVVVSVPESQVGRFRPGQAMGIALWSDPGRPFTGRVREIAGGADPVTRTYAVRVSALDPPPGTQLGMTASVTFAPSVDAGIVLLPLGALARADGNPAVWVFDPASGRVQPRAVTIGQIREDGVTVTGGIASGEIVVTAGVHKLRPGQVVRLADAPAADPSPAR